jgi:hypothetical protein
MKNTKESLRQLVHGWLGANEEALEIALDEVFAERDELLAACKLFLAYSNNDSDDGVEMMLAYAAAHQAVEAAVAKAEGVKE